MSDTNRIYDKLLNCTENISKAFEEYFDIFHGFNIEGQAYIVGGFLRDILLDRPIKDLDIIIYKGNKENILANIEEYNLEYRINSFNGYKIFYDNKQIDIWNVDDFIDGIEFNLEGLFYDIDKKVFKDLGFSNAIEENEIIEINKNNRSNRNYEERKQKMYREKEALIKELFKTEVIPETNVKNKIKENIKTNADSLDNER